MAKTKRPPLGTSATRDGVTVTRTKKAGGRNRKNAKAITERSTMAMRQIAYSLSMQFFSQADIALALGVSQPRVSQLLNAETAERRTILDRSEREWREREVLRTEHMQSKWAAKAEVNAPAANVYLNLAERKDRLLGLNI